MSLNRKEALGSDYELEKALGSDYEFEEKEGKESCRILL